MYLELAFAHPENKSDSKQRPERFTCRMGKKSNGPHEDVDTEHSYISFLEVSILNNVAPHPFSHRELLKGKVLGILKRYVKTNSEQWFDDAHLEHQITEIKYCAQPIELILRQMCAGTEKKN